MRVLIIEDESLAAGHLINLILQYDPRIEIAGRCDSVKKSVAWFEDNPAPDLAFMDIQLADGLSFEIFDKTYVGCPVIFTTAFNEYAIRAFKVNSIDYLLKPIDSGELGAAIGKFKMMFKTTGQFPVPHPETFDRILQSLTNNYKKRFVVKVGEHIRSIPVENILYFFSLDKGTFLHTSGNYNYILDYTLEQVESLIDPAMFFRINRKYLISLNSFTDIISFTNSRLILQLIHCKDEDVIVAREKVGRFKQWLDR
jgi:two-component system, LytTR family, response regulator